MLPGEGKNLQTWFTNGVSSRCGYAHAARRQQALPEAAHHRRYVQHVGRHSAINSTMQFRQPDELTPDKFPEFFSIVVPAELIRLGLVSNQEESHPYTSCTRQLWEGLLDPSPKHKPENN